MNVKFPQLIYFIDYGNRHLLLRFRLLPVNQSLLLETSLYQLSIQDSNINLKGSFYNDPTDEGLFDRTNKTLLSSIQVGYNEIIGFKRYLAPINNGEVNIILRSTKITVHLEDFQIYGLKTFLSDICSSYVGYQTSLIEIITKYKDELTPVEVKVEPIQDIQEVQIEIPPVEIKIENSELTDDYIQDILQLSPNNITTFFISKYMNNNIRLDNTIIYIPKLLYYTHQNKIDLYTIITSINYNPNELTARIKSLYNILYSTVTNKEIFDVNKQNIYIILFLLYVYSIKNNARAESKVYEFEVDLKVTFISYCNLIIKSLTVDNNILITIKEETKEETNNKINYSEVLDPLIKKYSYLLSIDRDLFIKNVLDNIKTNILELGNKDQPVLISNPILLDISIPTNNPPLNTKGGIEPYLTYSADIITPSYQLLQALSAGKIIKNVPIIISKYYQIITDIIFINIDNNINYFENEPISTLYIMNTFIQPHINDSYNRLYVMFQIVLPYLYDKYKISKFLNYYI